MLIATPDHSLYCLDELIETRRSILRYARTFPPGAERNRHRQVAVSMRALLRNGVILCTGTCASVNNRRTALAH
jgi:hypothetical protein